MPRHHIGRYGDLLESTDVLDVAFKKSRGSKVLVNGSGCSLRKYSSGVTNLMPMFEAKSLASDQHDVLQFGMPQRTDQRTNDQLSRWS